MWPDPPMTTTDSERGGEGKQHVSRHPVLESDVAGADKDHAVGDGGSASADRAALRRHAVHGLEFLRCVEFPDGTSVGGRNGAKNAIHAPCAEDTWHHD